MNTNFKPIYEWFQDRVNQSPDSNCLEYGETVWTYREINERANQLAHYLKRNGAGPESLIGIFQERSPQLIISILAVLKSGAAYVPISTTYPDERIAYIVNETNFKMILTGSSYVQKITTITDANPTSSVKLLDMDKELSHIAIESSNNMPSHNSPNDLAYIIYTSGSTGKPKGVMIEHRGIPNLVQEQIHKFQLNDHDRVLQYASISFDASVSEIFTTLIAGATLVLVPEDSLSIGEALHRILKKQRISVVTLVPSVLNGLPHEELPDLKTLVTAGEACTKKLIHYWAPKLNFLNAYGPTETTVCATIHACDAADEMISLGAPIAGTAVYLLNNQLQPVANGETGMLYISSMGLARGYVNEAALTARHFIDNPFTEGISDKLYRTGDICLQAADGVIEWIGRDDHQVKVSGIRIELGELEYALREYVDIQEAVVIYNFDQNTIGAYMKSASTPKPNISQIRNYLLTKFPSYMVPTRFLFVDEFALLTSGKIDRNNLPPMEDVRPDIEIAYVAPSTYLEKELSQIWGEVLKLDKVGTHDNFFELGGQSLMATQIVSRIRSVLGMEVPLHIIFSAKPTIEQTAVTLEEYQLEQMDATELELLLAELENE
ncbi:amino acid adenylation domain-containing protein [Paenibacillus sp. DS2015]|uniref:non-ribosomal peptide synthetase n=1 Tax=Paenibacillus sp. DS2015 TaxID=3373917 RepID=UPI003D1B6E05